MDMLMTMFWTVMRQMSTANGRTMNIPGDPFQAPAPRTYVAPPVMQAALPLALALDPDDQDVLMTGPTDTIHGMASLAPFPVPQEARNGDSPVIAPARLHPPSSGTSIEASPTTLLAMGDMDPLENPPVDLRRPDDGDNDSKDDSSNTSEATKSTNGSSNGDSCENDNSGDYSGDDFEENYADDPESDDY